MLIVLDDSLRGLLNDSADDWVIAAFENLATCCREGKHLLYAEIQLLHELARFEPLGQLTQGVYSALLNRASETARLPELFKRRIEVCTIKVPEYHEASDDTGCFKLPLTYFSDSERAQKTVLLGENRNDAAFYQLIGEVGLYRKSWRNAVRIAIEKRGGGGDTTANEFKEYRESGRLTLCMADSDKKHPKPEPGQTARDILKVQGKSFGVSEAYVLEVRDVENLIPQNILNEADKEQQNKLSAVAEFRKQYPDLFPYFDVKKGLSPFKVPKQEPWPKHEAALKQAAFDWPAACRGACPKKTCTCRLIPGLGDKVLEKVIDHLKGLGGVKAQSEAFGDSFQGEPAEIGEIVLAWCVAAQPMFT